MTTSGPISAAAWRGRYSTSRARTELWLSGLSWFAAALSLLPLFALLWLAFGGFQDLSSVYLGIVLPRALADTLLLLAGVGIGTAALGVGAAWLTSAFSFPGRALLTALLAMPLVMPTYIAAYVWAEILEPLGPVQSLLRATMGYASPRDYWFPPVRSLGGAIFIFSLVLYPYVFLTVRAVLAVQSASLLEAARMLGHSAGGVFARVALPLARPAIAAGVTLALLETLNDIGASEYLGVRTLTVTVMQTWLSRNSLGGAAFIACVMLLIVGLILLLERHLRRNRRYALPVQKPRFAAPVTLRGWRMALTILACLAPVAVGFVIPVVYLIGQAIRVSTQRGFDPAFFSQLGATLAVATVAAVVVMLFAVIIVVAQRNMPNVANRAAARIASLGYMVPGTVLAVGLLAPLAAFDDHVARWMRSLSGLSLGLLLTGTGAAIVIAYLIRFMAVAIGTLEGGLGRYSHHLDHAARALGRGTGAVIRRIHLPLMRPALIAAGILVFLDCLKELPATLLLRPMNFDTLATGLYAHASRGMFEDGSLQALAIVLAGLVPAIILARSGSRFEIEAMRATGGT